MTAKQKSRFPARLLYWRKRRHLTQRELAARTGVHAPRISEMERGLHPPNLSTIERLAAALEIAPRKLL